MNDDEFELFQDYFRRRTGIQFGAGKRAYIERRLDDRLAKTGEPSVRSYVTYLKYADRGDEMQSLVNAMTVNETYFNRETYQFNILVKAILPELTTERPDRPLSIWCVPCSTGEEPFSIAIWLLENWPSVDRHHIDILGSDIDSAVLATARRGEYDSRSLQHLSPRLREKYFRPAGPGRWRVIDALLRSVDFSSVNLTDAGQMKQHGEHDVVFCRNVLIYFDDESRRIAAERLYEALRPGGFLCLGLSLIHI